MDEQRPWPSAARGWVLVALLALASIVSQWDRTVLNLMVEPIKAQFGLDDTGFGALQSIAFGIFYTLACIPIGRLADRYPRRVILAGALALWSVFACMSGLARSYVQLFLTRIGVGVGEATLTPAAFSLLSDHFPPERLGKPVGAFLMSAPVGQGLGFIAGGALLSWLTASTVLDTGAFSSLEPWPAAIMIVGAPGLLLAPLFLLLREPVRRGPGGATPLPVREVVAVFRARAAAFVPMFTGFCMVSLVSYAFVVWMPTVLSRSYGLDPAQAGLAFGLVVLICGTSGAYLGGFMSDRLARRGVLDAPLKVAAFGFVGCGVFGALAPLMPTPALAITFLVPAIFLSNTPYACAGTAIQLITPNRARAQMSAVYITLTTLIGLGVGPLVVGLMTDHVFHDPAQIRYSLAIVVALPAPIMFTLLMLARKPYRALRATAVT